MVSRSVRVCSIFTPESDFDVVPCPTTLTGPTPKQIREFQSNRFPPTHVRAMRRLVDHEQRLSFAVIFGSFRSKGVEGPDLDQHYVSLSYLHEPIGGILPAETEDEQIPKTNNNANTTDETNVNRDSEAPMSPQERFSAITDRLGTWMQTQKKAALRGFGPGQRRDESVTPGENVASAADKEEENAADVDMEATKDPLSGRKDGTGLEGDERARSDFGLPGEDERIEAGEERNDRGFRNEGDLIREEGADGGEMDSDSAAAPASRESPVLVAPSTEGIESVTTTGEDVMTKYGDGVTEESILQRGRGAARGAHERDLRDSATTSEQLSETAEGDGGAEDGILEQMPVASAVKQLPLEEFVLPNGSPPQVHAKKQHLERTHTFHAFPSPDTVTISCRGEPVKKIPNLIDDPNFSWEADGIG